MRKFKPLLAVSLIVIILFLSGCANIQSLLTSNHSDFYEITAYSDFAEMYYSVDISGDNILFLTASGIDDYVLSVYNVEKNSISEKRSMTGCPLEYISEARFGSSDQIIVCDDSNEKAVTYDLSLNETGAIDYPYVDYRDVAPESPLLTDFFTYYDTYAVSYEEDYRYFVFYDDPEKVYATPLKNEFIHSSAESKLFTAETKYSDNDDIQNTTVYVKDIKSGLSINSHELEAVSKGISSDVILGAISDEYVCFINQVSNDNTGASLIKPYVWKYAESPENEAFEVNSMTEAGILENSEKLISEIKSKYGINVYANEKPEFGREVELGAGPLQINHVLTQLSECLDLFPENFLKEIYQNADGVIGLNIYIVDDIYGAGAFAVDFFENYELCFGCRSFGKSVIFHEFMHLIDNRIQDYYEENGMDLRDEWQKLNPEDFEYGSDTEDYEYDVNYFISLYATTNSEEDLADMFQAMFEAYDNSDDSRFTNFEYVGKKAAFICEAIRKAFPCMQNAEDVCWEKYVGLIK